MRVLVPADGTSGSRLDVLSRLVAVLGAPPSGLVERADLPAVPGIELAARARDGASPEVVAAVLAALRQVLAPGVAFAVPAGA